MVTWKPFVHARSMWNMQNTIMPSSKCAYTSIDAYIYAYINLFLSLLLEIYVFHTFLLHFSFTKCDIYEWWMIAKLDLLWHGIGSEFAMYDSISSPHTMARNFQTNRAILAVVARKKIKNFHTHFTPTYENIPYPSLRFRGFFRNVLHMHTNNNRRLYGECW